MCGPQGQGVLGSHLLFNRHPVVHLVLDGVLQPVPRILRRHGDGGAFDNTSSSICGAESLAAAGWERCSCAVFRAGTAESLGHIAAGELWFFVLNGPELLAGHSRGCCVRQFVLLEGLSSSTLALSGALCQKGRAVAAGVCSTPSSTGELTGDLMSQPCWAGFDVGALNCMTAWVFRRRCASSCTNVRCCPKGQCMTECILLICSAHTQIASTVHAVFAGQCIFWRSGCTLC